MKLKQIKEEINMMKSPAEISKNILELRNELFALRIQSKTSHVKDNSLINKIKKNIARMETRLSQLESQ